MTEFLEDAAPTCWLFLPERFFVVKQLFYKVMILKSSDSDLPFIHIILFKGKKSLILSV